MLKNLTSASPHTALATPVSICRKSLILLILCGSHPCLGSARQIDRSYTDDLYLPSAAETKNENPWVIGPELLARAVVDGQAAIDTQNLLDGRPTMSLRPADTTKRATAAWTVPVEPAQFYCFSAAARSTDRLPDDPPEFMPMYSLLGIRWLDAAGKPIGTRDKLVSRPAAESFWHVKQVKGLAPPGAAHARLSLTAGWHRQRDDLNAWFADIHWGPEYICPVSLELWPRVLRSADEPFVISLRRTHRAALSADGTMYIELVGPAGTVERTWSTPNLITLPWITRTTLPAGATGKWTLRVRIETIKDYPGKRNWQLSEPVLVANSQLAQRLADGRFVVDGRKRFVIGMYHTQPQDWPALKAAGVNTVLYKSYDADQAAKEFDTLAELGLWAFAHLGGGGQTRANQPRLEAVVKTLKDHPALLAWSLFDEPTRKGVGPREIAQYGCWVQSLAPQVPTTVNCCGPYTFDRFASTVDLFSVDPYPVYTWADYRRDHADLGQVSQWMNLVRTHVPPRRGYIGVVECFTFDKKQKPPATPAEIRNMVYQVLAGGASGLIYYSYREAAWYLPDEPQFQEIAALNAEIAQLEPWLVTVPLNSDQHVLQFETPTPDRLVTATWKRNNKYMTVLINLDRHKQLVNVRAEQTRLFQAYPTELPQRLELQPLAVKRLEYGPI